MADYNLNAHFGATDDISPALSQIIAGLQAASAAQAAFQASAASTGQAAQQGFAAAGQAAQQATQHTQAAGAAATQTAGSVGQMGTAASAAGVHIGALNVTLQQSGQHASQAQTMYLSLGAALNQLPGPLGAVAAGFGMLHGRISEAQAGLLAVSTTMGVLASSLASGIGQTVEAGMQFQRTFAEVQIVMNATAEQMKALQAAAIEVGVSTQFNAQQAAQGLYELGSAGFTAKESIQALTPITTAAMLGNRQLGDTTKDVIAGIRQFGLEAKDTTHVVDVMTTAVQGSVVHWNEIGGLFENLRGRMGQLRIPMEDVVAAEMLMTNSGLGASQAATAIGTAVDRLSKQTRETAQGLKELGLNVFDNEGRFVGLLNVYTQLEAKLPTMTMAQQAHAMAMLGGSKAAGAFLDILQQTQAVMVNGEEVTLKGAELFNHWAEALRNSDGASERAAKILGETLDVQLRKFHGSLGEASIRIGTQFIPALSAIVPAAMDAVNMFVHADSSIHTMTASVLTATVAFGAWTAATGAWAAMQATSFGPALLAARAAIVALVPELLLVTAASAALGLAWSQDWGNIREHTQEAADAIGSSVHQVSDDLANLMKYMTTIELPKLKVQIETGFGDTGVGQLFAELGDAKNLLAATEAGKKAGDAWNLGFALVIQNNPFVPTNWLRWGQEVIAKLHDIQPGIKQALHDAMSPEQIADEQAGELDKLAYGAVSKIKQGADLESAAMGALWDQVIEAEKQGINKSGDVTQANLDLVIGRVKQLMAKGGSDIGFALASSIAGSGNAVQDSINRLMTEAGGQLSKAIGMALEGSDQQAATQLMNMAAQHKVITAALQGSTSAYQAQVEIIERTRGPLAALNQLYSDGHINLDQYNAAQVGIVKSARDEAKANDELEKSLKALHAAMTPGQKLYETQAQNVVQGVTQGLSIDARARLADFAQGKTAQEQLKQMVDAAGVSGVTLSDLYYGTPKQNEDRIALLAAALQGGAVNKLAPVIKASTQQAYGTGVAEGIKAGQPAAEQAAADSGTATAAALNASLKAGLSNAGTLATQFAIDLSNGMDFTLARSRLENALAVDPETYRGQGAAAGEATTDGVAVAIDLGKPKVDTAATTLGAGIRTAIEGQLTPERAKNIVETFLTQLTTGWDVSGLGKALGGALLASFAPGVLFDLIGGALVTLGGQLLGKIGEGIASGDKEALAANINQILTGALTVQGSQIANFAGIFIKTISDEMANQIIGNAELVKTGGVIVGKIAEGLTVDIDKIPSALVTGLLGALNPVVMLAAMDPQLVATGAGIVSGIVEGIKAAIPGAATGAAAAAGSLVDAIKVKLGITSPSTVMAEQVGRPMAEGIGAGFSGAMGGVQAQIQSGVASLVSGATAEFGRGMGQLVKEVDDQIGMEIKKTDPTVPFSPLTMPGQAAVPGYTPGFSEHMANWTEKLLNTLEITSYDTSKSGINMAPIGIRSNAKYKGPLSTMGPINFDYPGDYTGAEDNEPATWDPYNQGPATPQDDLIAFGPGGRRNLARGASVNLSRLISNANDTRGPGNEAVDEAVTEIAEALAPAIVQAVRTAEIPGITRPVDIYRDQGGWGPAIFGGVGNAPGMGHNPTQQEISAFIAAHPESVPVYGPRQDEQAQYNRMREILQGRATVNVGGRQVPAVSPYSNTTPAFVNQQLANMVPMNTEIVGYRDYTPAEANEIITPRMRYGVMGQEIPLNPNMDPTRFNPQGGPPSPAALPYRPVGTTLPDGRVMGPGGNWMTPAEWQQYSQYSGAQATPASMALTPFVQGPAPISNIPNPRPRPDNSNLGGVANSGIDASGNMTEGALANFMASLRPGAMGFTRNPALQPTVFDSPEMTDERRAMLDAYTSQRQALRESGQTVGDFQSRVARADQGIADLTGTFRGYMATTDQVRMTEEEWRASLGGAVGETEGTFAHLNGAAQTTRQYMNDLGDATRRPMSTFTQVGDISVGLGVALGGSTRAADDFRSHAALVSDGLGTSASALTSFQGVVRDSNGVIDSLATSGARLMAAQGQYFDQFGQLQSRLVDVTASLGAMASSADDLVSGFQDTAAIFPGEGGPGLSSGFGGPFFNASLGGPNGSLLPGNVNPGDYYSPAGFGNGFNPNQPLGGPVSPGMAGALTVLLSRLSAAGANPMPSGLANVAWLQGPGAAVNPLTGRFEGNGNQAMSPDLMFQLGFGGDQGQMALRNPTQRMLYERFGISPGTISSQGFNQRVADLISAGTLGGGGQSVNAQGQSVSEYYDQIKQISQAGGTSPTVNVGSGLATSLAFISASGTVQQDPITGGDALAKLQVDVTRNWTVAKDNAKRLADSSSLVGQAWSSIADLSKSVDSSIAHVAGAFAAMPAGGFGNAASAIAAVTAAGYQTPGLGNPTVNTGGSGPAPTNGGTYGAQSGFALQQLIDQLAARGIQGGDTNFQSELTKLRQTDSEYIRVVGQTTETLGDYRREQEDAQQEVSNLSNVMNQLGSAYGSGIGIAAQLAAAQARLAAATAGAATAVANTPGPAIPGYNQYNQPGGAQGPSYYTPVGSGTIANTIATAPGPNGTTLSGVNQSGGSQQAFVSIQGVLVPAGASSQESLAILAAHGIFPELPVNPRVFGQGGIVTGRQLAIVGDEGPELIAPLADLFPGTAGPALTSITPNAPLSSVAGTRFDLMGSTLNSIGGHRSFGFEAGTGGTPSNYQGSAPSSAPPPPLAPYKALGGIGVGADGITTWNGIPIPGYQITADGIWLEKDGVRLTDQEAQILARLKGVNLSQAQLYALLGTEPPPPGTTGSTTSATVSGTPAKNYGPVHKINSTGTSDFYQQPDGSILQVPHGSGITTDQTGFGYGQHHLPVNLSGSTTAAAAIAVSPPAFIANPTSAPAGTRMIRTDDKWDTYIEPDGTIIQVPHGSVPAVDIGGRITWGPPLPTTTTTPTATTPTGPFEVTHTGGTTTGSITNTPTGPLVPTSAILEPTTHILPAPTFTGGIRGYADGGIAWNPQLAMLAENGPEQITPLSQQRGGAGNVTIGDIHIHVVSQGNTVADVAEIGRKLREEWARSGIELRRRGGV